MAYPSANTGGGAPFGNAFLIRTPALDRASQLLYQQQMLRQQQFQQYQSTVDQQMASQMGNVRNVDIPDITDAWAKYRQAKQDVLFNDQVKNNPQLFQQRSIQAAEALGEFYQKVGASRQQRDLLTMQNRDWYQHPNEYQERYGDYSTAGMNTPLDQLHNATVNGKQVDLTDPMTYRDLSPAYDFGKVVSAARGKPTPQGAPIVTKDGLNMYSSSSMYGSNAATLFNNIRTTIASAPGAERNAARMWSRLQATPEEIDRVNQEYASLKPEDWQARTGSTDPQSITVANPNSASENYAAYLAKRDFVENRPTQSVPRLSTDILGKINATQAATLSRQETMARIRNGYKLGEDQFQNDLKNLNTADQGLGIQQAVQGYEERARQNSPQLEYYNGQHVNAYPVENSPELAKVFSRTDPKTGKMVAADQIRLTSDGRWIGSWFQRDKDTNEPLVVPGQNGQPDSYPLSKSLPPLTLSKQGVLQGFAHEYLPKSQAGKSLKNQPGQNQTHTVEWNQ